MEQHAMHHTANVFIRKRGEIAGRPVVTHVPNASFGDAPRTDGACALDLFCLRFATCVLQRHCDEMLGIALIRCLRRVFVLHKHHTHGHTKCASLVDDEWIEDWALTNEIGTQQQWQIIWANCMQNAYESCASFTAPLTMSAKTERMHGYIFSIYLILSYSYLRLLWWSDLLFCIVRSQFAAEIWIRMSSFHFVNCLVAFMLCACVEASTRIARNKQNINAELAVGTIRHQVALHQQRGQAVDCCSFCIHLSVFRISFVCRSPKTGRELEN